MTYNITMKKVLILIMTTLIPVFSFAVDSSLTYYNGLSYGDAVLKGDAAWDHLNQCNMQTGLVYISPLEENPRFGSRIRIAFDQPLWAVVNRLDGVQNTVQVPGGFSYGANFFAGLEIPLTLNEFLFDSSSAYAGPVFGFQAMADSMLVTLGMEGGVDAGLALSEKWSFITGLSVYYNFWGIHSIGDSTRYDLYLQRAWGIILRPGIRFTY